jgi:hypothetical protein
MTRKSKGRKSKARKPFLTRAPFFLITIIISRNRIAMHYSIIENRYQNYTQTSNTTALLLTQRPRSVLAQRAI